MTPCMPDLQAIHAIRSGIVRYVATTASSAVGGRIAGTLLMVQEALQAKPVASIASLTAATGLTTPTVTTALRELVSLGIARETTGRALGRVFAYKRYLEAMSAEEEHAPATIPNH